MIAAGAYFMADMANLSISSHLESMIGPRPEVSSTVGSPTLRQGKKGAENYRVIVQKNIFNSASKPAVVSTPGESKSVPIQQVSLPPLNLTLVGTANPYAIIKDPKEKKQKLYRKGDVIGMVIGQSDVNKPKLVSVNRNKVVLLRGGKKEVLEVEIKSKKSKTAKRVSARNRSPKPKAADTIQQVSDNQWVLDRRELDDAMKNLPQLLTKARVIPSFKDGKPDGFRIFAIAKDSLYAKIGLQNGDILHRINSVDVKSPQNFMKVIEQLKDENSINVDLVRNNQKETFSYEIR